MKTFRGNQGFTLVELLVVVVIIGIISAIALPNFIGAQQKAKTASVKGNMRTTQLASECYATDSGAIYANNFNLMRPYYPGGDNKLGGSAGNFPTNPVTGVTNEPPIPAGPTTAAAIQTLRASLPGPNGNNGRHTYNQADAGASYSIVGVDASGRWIAGANGKVLVLSNQ